MPGTTARSGAAERAERPGQHRSWRSRRRARLGAPLLGAALLLSGCAAADEESADAPAADASTAADETALATACTTFWGDPDYVAPLSRTVLDRAATAPEAGPSDPLFYAMTGDDIDAAFADAPPTAQEAAAALATWFRTEPERGADADPGSFRSAWEGVAGSCQEHSAAALWTLAPGEAGTKPPALVCADVFDTPGTLTHFANANVLTSNMFKLVGLSPRTVPADRGEDVRATAELLEAEITAVDDAAVADALEQVQDPFEDALAGDASSDGLRAPLAALGSACESAGYSAPGVDELGAVVGASADRHHDIPQGGRS